MPTTQQQAPIDPRTLVTTRNRVARIADQTEIERVEEKLAHPLGAGILATLEEEVVAVINTDYAALCDGDKITAARVREARLADLALAAVSQWQTACIEEIENARG